MLCHVSVHNGAFCLRHRVLVAFFDRVALFSDFNHLFELLDLLYIGIMLKKHLKTLTANFMNNFHVGNVSVPIQSRVGQGFWVYGIQGLFKSGIRYIAS